MMMGKALNADIASGFFSAGSFDLRKEWFEGKMISLTNEIFKKWFRHLKLKFAFLFKTGFLKEYDTVIFSGDSISAVRNCSQHQKKIYYCHTPPRYLYDLHELYVKKVPFLLRPFFKIACSLFKKMYEKDLSKMDLVLTNSKNTQQRIQKFLWVKSEILYPPVDQSLFSFQWQKDYYLSFARLADAKRVDRVVQAFQKILDKNLVIIYGENDPQRQKIFDLAQGYENISFVTLPWNVGFYEYVWNAIATIYVPVDEDFWMSPVESMAAGKPVIWVDEWWLKETILHNTTGILISKDCKVEEIVQAVWELTPEKCFEMRENCEKRAEEFGFPAFAGKLQTYV